jgi:hypothetical protein
MPRHLASTRHFPMAYSQSHQHVTVSDSFRARPLPGGSLVLWPMPVGLGGQPFLGMDPSDPTTWVRPYNPQPGMVERLNFDGAKHQAMTPMGGTWRNTMRDRHDVGRGWLRWRKLWPTARRSSATGSWGSRLTR